MSSRSDTSLAALLLVQRLVEVDAPPLKASEYWSLLARVPDPARLLGLDAAGIAALAQVGADEAERIARLLDAAAGLAFQMDELQQGGIRLVTSVDPDYPARLSERLGTAAPPILYAAGDIGLAHQRLLGVVGLPDVSPAGAEAATGAAREAAQHDTGVVTGGAEGLDQVTMRAALGAGTTVVGVLADPLLRGTSDPEVRRAISSGRMCLCTPYKPTARFTAANAVGRNKIIYALSAATLVVAAETGRGATWAGAVEALRQRTAPVLAWRGMGTTEGDELLVGRGARPIRAVEVLFPLPECEPRLDPSATQLGLGL